MKKPIEKIFYGKGNQINILFISNCSFSDAIKRMKKYKIPAFKIRKKSDGFMVKIKYIKNSNIRNFLLVIWIKDRKNFCTLNHEVVHLCIEIFEILKKNINRNTSEDFASCCGFWFRKLWKLMNK